MGLKPFSENTTTHDQLTAVCKICRHTIRPDDARVQSTDPYRPGLIHEYCAPKERAS
jgi:hypothetical protein